MSFLARRPDTVSSAPAYATQSNAVSTDAGAANGASVTAAAGQPHDDGAQPTDAPARGFIAEAIHNAQYALGAVVPIEGLNTNMTASAGQGGAGAVPSHGLYAGNRYPNP